MNEQTTTPATEVSFKDFLFKNKRNRTILVLAAVAIVVQFAIFKYLYPYASFIHGDSFSYINAADKNLSINTYLIGYSKFLRLFSVFAKPDYILVAFQYLFIQYSMLFLLFTIFYFYKPGKVTQLILLCFMVFNPLFLHLGNMVSSDGLFLALSLIWFSLLLWIIHRPSNRIIIWHAVVLFIAFTVRYNAMIYPCIACVAFWISKLPLPKKLLGMGLGLLICGWFVGFTMFQYKKLTGNWQYSPFSGWQFANNAMYAYRYVDSSQRKQVPEKFRELDNMIREFFDSTRNTVKHPTEAIMASTFYMWSPAMPLMKYKTKQFKNDTSSTELKKWASMGPIFKDYGTYIIKQYPWHFARYFIWPNANKYYAPPIEFLQSYNSGKKDVTKQAKTWFGYKTRTVQPRLKNYKVMVLDFYPILSGIINVVMTCCLICFLILKGWRYTPIFRYPVWMGCTVWLVNALFTIGASSAALRFQSFPIILTTVCVLLLVDWIVKVMNIVKTQEAKNKHIQEDIKQLKEHLTVQ